MSGRILLQSPWAVVPMALIEQADITLADLRVYMNIDHLAGKRGTWYGPIDELVALTGSGRRSVERSVAKLREGGFIATKREGPSRGSVLHFAILARVTPAIFGGSTTANAGGTSRHSRRGGHANAGGSEQPTLIGRARAVETTLETTIEPPPPSARTSREWFLYAFDEAPTRGQGDELDGYDVAHPPTCIEWVFREVMAWRAPSLLRLRQMFNECGPMLDNHGPRERRPYGRTADNGNGAAAGAGAVRAVPGGDYGRPRSARRGLGHAW